MRVSTRILAAAVAGTLVAGPTAHARTSTQVGPAATDTPAATDPLAEAKAAHAQGQVYFDTAEYERAIEEWTRAYAALPPKEPKSATYRPLILYNIATAREKLFELRGDVTELKQAKILLERFDASIDEVYGHDPAGAEAERTRVREKIAELDGRIRDAQAPEPEPVADPKPDPTPPDPGPGDPTTPAGPADRPPSSAGRGLMIGGGVLVGLGVAAIGGLAGAAVISNRANDIDDLDENDLQGREDRFAQGRAANAGAIAMAVVAPLLLGGGIALLVLGAKRRSPRVSAAPAFGPGGVAWVVRGRF